MAAMKSDGFGFRRKRACVPHDMLQAMPEPPPRVDVAEQDPEMVRAPVGEPFLRWIGDRCPHCAHSIVNRCPHCGSVKHRIRTTRYAGKTTLRWHTCKDCGAGFRSMEWD